MANGGVAANDADSIFGYRLYPAKDIVVNDGYEVSSYKTRPLSR